jgi:hypothetical protein
MKRKLTKGVTKMQRSNGSREVIGWKVLPNSWYPKIGLFDHESQRLARKREAEKAAEKKAQQAAFISPPAAIALFLVVATFAVMFALQVIPLLRK